MPPKVSRPKIRVYGSLPLNMVVSFPVIASTVDVVCVTISQDCLHIALDVLYSIRAIMLPKLKSSRP